MSSISDEDDSEEEKGDVLKKILKANGEKDKGGEEKESVDKKHYNDGKKKKENAGRREAIDLKKEKIVMKIKVMKIMSKCVE